MYTPPYQLLTPPPRGHACTFPIPPRSPPAAPAPLAPFPPPIPPGCLFEALRSYAAYPVFG